MPRIFPFAFMPETENHSFVLCVTGGIACGKSSAGKVLEASGFCTLDADRVAHELMAKGRPVCRAVAREFGAGVLDAAGEIDRSALGSIVFEDPEKLGALNALVHPAVRRALADWIRRMRRERRKAAALVPLLFESGMEELDWDAVLCVTADEETVLRRLAARGLDREAARRRIRAQWPPEEKARRADYVLSGNEDLKRFGESVRKLLKRIDSEKTV